MDDDETVRARILRMIGEAPDDLPGLPLRKIPLHEQRVLSAMLTAGEVEVIETRMVGDPSKFANYIRLR